MADLRELPPGGGKYMNPFIIVVNFVMAGIVVLFFALSYGYIFTMGSGWIEFKLPKVFWLSTVCILAVSFFLRRSQRYYDLDRPAPLRRSILIAMIMASLFIVCQVIGWTELYSSGKNLQISPSVSYLYVLTGLHAAHVLVGIIFLIVAVYRFWINTLDPVKSLLFFTDPARKARLKMLCTYWHTIDFLWVFIFLAFLFKHA